MGASSVVVLQPWRKGCGPVTVACEHLAVGPFGGQGPVQSFDLAVLPRTVRLDELLGNAMFSTYSTQAVPVCPRVIGHQPLDPGDAPGGEVGDCALEEACAGLPCLIGQDLAIGQAGIVIDH